MVRTPALCAAAAVASRVFVVMYAIGANEKPPSCGAECGWRELITGTLLQVLGTAKVMLLAERFLYVLVRCCSAIVSAARITMALTIFCKHSHALPSLMQIATDTHVLQVVDPNIVMNILCSATALCHWGKAPNTILNLVLPNIGCNSAS